jgi:hypothetical protein
MFLLTLYLMQIQTMSTGSTQWNKQWWNGGQGLIQMMVNANTCRWEGTQMSMGEQWWEWNQHVAAAALEAAPQQLQP